VIGATEEPWKKRVFEGLEDSSEIVVVARDVEEAFSAAGLAAVIGLLETGFRGDVAAVAVGVA